MARRWTNDRVIFTLNNYTDQDILDLKGNNKITYLIFGYEVGENGTPHLQGYLEVKRRAELNWYKRHIHKTAHFEPRRGKLAEAIAYCKKGEQSKKEWEEHKEQGENYGKNVNFYEQGEPKPDRKQGKRSDLELVKKIVMKDKASMIDVIEQCTSYQALRGAQIMMTYRGYTKDDIPKDIYWFYGPTGSGKTRSAVEAGIKNGSYWLTSDTLQWFDGYYNQEVVIIDDYRTKMCSYNFLLRLLDRYPLRVPIKGGFVEWLPKVIYITSNKHPEEMYTWEEKTRDDIDQLLRRITKLVNFDIAQEVEDFFK